MRRFILITNSRCGSLAINIAEMNGKIVRPLEKLDEALPDIYRIAIPDHGGFGCVPRALDIDDLHRDRQCSRCWTTTSAPSSRAPTRRVRRPFGAFLLSCRPKR
jgi:hypothetical protein